MGRYDIVPSFWIRRRLDWARVAITAARTIVPHGGGLSSPHASSCRRNTGVGRFSVAITTFVKGLLKRIRTIELLKKHLLDDEAARAREYERVQLFKSR
jgi:hypothetical protein